MNIYVVPFIQISMNAKRTNTTVTRTRRARTQMVHSRVAVTKATVETECRAQVMTV